MIGSGDSNNNGGAAASDYGEALDSDAAMRDERHVDVGDLHPNALALFTSHGGDDEDVDEDDDLTCMQPGADDDATTQQSMLHASTHVLLEARRASRFDSPDAAVGDALADDQGVRAWSFSSAGGDGESDDDSAFGVVAGPRRFRPRRNPHRRRVTWNDERLAVVTTMHFTDFWMNMAMDPSAPVYNKVPEAMRVKFMQRHAGVGFPGFQRPHAAPRALQLPEPPTESAQNWIRGLTRASAALSDRRPVPALPPPISPAARAADAAVQLETIDGRRRLAAFAALLARRPNALRDCFTPRQWPVPEAAAQTRATDATPAADDGAGVALPDFFSRRAPRCGLADGSGAAAGAADAAAATHVRRFTVQLVDPSAPRPLDAGGQVRPPAADFVPLRISSVRVLSS